MYGEDTAGGNRHIVLILYFSPQEIRLIKNTPNIWLLTYRQMFTERETSSVIEEPTKKKENPSSVRQNINNISELKSHL